MWHGRLWGALVVVLASAGPVVAVGSRKAPPAAKSMHAPVAGAFRSAIVVEAASGTVLFEKDAHLPGPPASMTKMMLMLLVAEAVRDGKLRWDDPVKVSVRASQMGGSQVYLKSGEVFSLAEMMQAVVIHSANDAAFAVAEHVAGSATAFVARMNERAEQLGMGDTRFRSVHGLPPEAGQPADLSSARDLAVLARAVVQFAELLRWSSTKETTFRNGTLVLTNTNRLVRETNWVDGLKTGYYGEAGFNVTATAQREGMRLIAVVMGVPDKHECFSKAASLLSDGFAHYHAVTPVRQGDVVANDVAVRDGRRRFVQVLAGSGLTVLARRGQKRSFTLQLALPKQIEAPLVARQVVGEVVVRDGDAVVGKVPAIAAEGIERGTLWDRIF